MTKEENIDTKEQIADERLSEDELDAIAGGTTGNANNPPTEEIDWSKVKFGSLNPLTTYDGGTTGK